MSGAVMPLFLGPVDHGNWVEDISTSLGKLQNAPHSLTFTAKTRPTLENWLLSLDCL